MAYPEDSSGRNKGVDESIRDLAAQRFGTITVAQLTALGLASSQITRRVRKGALIRIHEGVYAINGFPASWEQKLMAAHSWLGDGSVVSHRSAARLWRLDGIELDILELSCASKRKPKPGIHIHHVDEWDPRDLRWRGPFRVTGVERTLTDLAAVVDSDLLEDALESALRQRITTLDRIAATLTERSGHGFPGCKRLRRLIERRAPADPATESRLETAWARIVRKGGFPLPLRQVTMVLGGEKRRPDFVWPDAKVAVEVDGWKYHAGRKQWHKDSRESNLLQVEGWVVLRFAKEDILDDPAYVVETIGAVLYPRLA